MHSFGDLVQSRRAWIDEVLIPWCNVSSRKDLLLAEHEWQDLAGRPAPEMTLWKWAWERFPVLAEHGLNTINETNPVIVQCEDGRTGAGYPDAQRSLGGLLCLIDDQGQLVGPFAIDEISSIQVACGGENDMTNEKIHL